MMDCGVVALLSPEGAAVHSPGRESWDTRRSTKGTLLSPEGATETAIARELPSPLRGSIKSTHVHFSEPGLTPWALDRRPPGAQERTTPESSSSHGVFATRDNGEIFGDGQEHAWVLDRLVSRLCHGP